MPDSFAVDQSPAENHIAAALAVDGLPISCGFAEAGSKLFRGREPVRPKLRIAAGEVDRIRSAAAAPVARRTDLRARPRTRSTWMPAPIWLAQRSMTLSAISTSPAGTRPR